MRKVGMEQHLEEKKKKNATYISLFMLAVLVLGTIGYAFSTFQGNSDGTQNGQQNLEGGVEFEGQTFYFSNTIEQVNNVSIEGNYNLNDYVGKTLYIAAENPSVLTDALQFLSKYSSKIQEACYGPCEKDLPEKECSENLIIWKDSEENKVFKNESCVFIEGDSRAVDALVFKLMGKN